MCEQTKEQLVEERNEIERKYQIVEKQQADLKLWKEGLINHYKVVDEKIKNFSE